MRSDWIGIDWFDWLDVNIQFRIVLWVLTIVAVGFVFYFVMQNINAQQQVPYSQSQPVVQSHEAIVHHVPVSVHHVPATGSRKLH